MATVGGVFDPDKLDDLKERLRQAPGEEARKELAATPEGPAPTRWSLRAIRATFDWLHSYTLSGVWYLLRRCDFKLRPGREQQYSPDPEYCQKVAYLVKVLQETAEYPDTRVLALFGRDDLSTLADRQRHLVCHK